MKCQVESQKFITSKDMRVSWYSQAEVVTTEPEIVEELI
jgi:hypothetical protein